METLVSYGRRPTYVPNVCDIVSLCLLHLYICVLCVLCFWGNDLHFVTLLVYDMKLRADAIACPSLHDKSALCGLVSPKGTSKIEVLGWLL
jgi:hypothetical protein